MGTLVLAGAFSRSLINTAYALLFLWGLALLGRAVLNRNPSHLIRTALPPTRWAIGLATFALAWFIATLAGGSPVVGLKELAMYLYLLALPFLAWAVFNQRPDLPARLPFLWGLGLIVAAMLTFREGGYQLICLRAKAYLGVIELGSVLGQLVPIMLAALLANFLTGCRKKTVFFALALAAACLALAQNCSRQALLAVPLLSLLMLFAYRRHFSHATRRILIVLASLVILLPLIVGGQRFFETTVEFAPDPGEPVSIALSASDNIRVTLWKHGLNTFLTHPVLGQGLGSGFNLELHPEEGEVLVSHTHQMLIDVMAKTGIFGFLGFLALHLAPLSLLWPHRHSQDPETFFWVWAALAVSLQLLLNGLTDQIFGLKPMMYIHWTVIAAALWQTHRSQKEVPYCCNQSYPN